MDPISLLTAALIAGAIAGTTQTAGEVVTDLYQGLKSAIVAKFRKEPPELKALETPERDEPGYEERLASTLRVADLEGDDDLQDLLARARSILELVGAPTDGGGKYRVSDMRHAKGVQIGDGNEQRNKF